VLLRENGSAARPWLTAVIDDYSRAIAGYYPSFDPPSSLRTSLALRQGIWRKAEPRWRICGIPDVLYADNGADFTSNHLGQVAVDLKMRLVFSTPGKPQGRGKIERFFRTVNKPRRGQPSGERGDTSDTAFCGNWFPRGESIDKRERQRLQGNGLVSLSYDRRPMNSKAWQIMGASLRITPPRPINNLLSRTIRGVFGSCRTSGTTFFSAADDSSLQFRREHVYRACMVSRLAVTNAPSMSDSAI
jgi:transposase InsO family protein